MRVQRSSLSPFSLLLALCFCSADPASAQASLLGPGAAFISGGVAQIDNIDLNQRLASHGYPTFDRNAVTIGIGGYRTLKSNIMLGAELTGLILGEKALARGNVGLGGGIATLGIGYNIRLSQHIRAYPRLGLGAGGFGLWIDDDEDSVAFNDVLRDPRPTPAFNDPSMSRGGAVIDLGGGVEFVTGRRGSGPLIGVRLGYIIVSSSSDWEAYDRRVTGGPDSSISGFYVRAILGGAWRR